VSIGPGGTSALLAAWYGAPAGLGPPNMTKGSDMERQLTFIDVDENRLELWLKPDRVQLVVIDSRPELEAGELRRFASVLFAEYVARDLADHLAAARGRLQEARDRAGGGEPGAGASSGHAADPAPGALVAALDGALRAIDELAVAVAIPEPLPVPVEFPDALEDEPAPVWRLGPDEPAKPREPIVVRPAGDRRYPLPQSLTQALHRPSPRSSPEASPRPSPEASLQASLRAARRASRKRSRGDRAEEASAIRWGGSIVAVR
jgi:hypothetical protein